MRIDKEHLICTVNARQLRNAFKYFDDDCFSSEDLASQLNTCSNIYNVLKLLTENNIIQVSERGENLYELTMKGNQIKNAKMYPPIKRTTADIAIESLIKRAISINENTTYLYTISKLTVFGSYVSNRPLINDIDIKSALTRREKDSSRFKMLSEKYVEKARKEGKKFHSFYEELYWPEKEIYQILKNKSKYLSFSSDTDDFITAGPHKIIYENSIEL